MTDGSGHVEQPVGHAHPELVGDGAEIGRVEARGIDYIPEEERHSKPANLFWVWVGTQMCFGIIVVGWLPVAFGLGWWSSVTAITVGLALGSLLYAPFSLLGPRTGTNSAVSSGAHFGLVGRLVGSLQAMFIALGFVSLTIWSGGDAIVSGLAKLIGTPDDDGMRILVYAILGATVIAIAIYGHATVLVAQKFLVPTIGVVLLVGFFAKLGDFDPGYKGGDYLLGGFWATWALAATTALAMPISYSPFANDFARYVSRERYSNGAVTLAAGAGMFVGCWLTLVFAAYMSTMFKDVSTPFVSGLVGISADWYVVLILLIGVFGSFAQGALGLYGTGLDTSSIFPRLRRVPATLLIAAVAMAIVYVGGLVLDAVDTVSAFLLILNVVCAPWMLITLMGLWYCRGRYHPYDLQLFNMGKAGGAYWYWHGINVRAFVAFVPAVVVGVLFVNTTIYKGPWADAASGVDLSFISSAVIAVVLYGVALLASPERNHPARDEPEVALTEAQLLAAATSTVAVGD
jgi:purine-cytosine permease-like protein